MGVVDTSKGATVTVPALPSDRYVSVYLVDNDHYCPLVIDPGCTNCPGTPNTLGLVVRIQVINPKDTAEIARVNALQDQFIITARSADPLPAFTWDLASLKALTARYEKESAQYSGFKGMLGPRGKVRMRRPWHIVAAAGWGLSLEWDATYLNYSGGQDPLDKVLQGHVSTAAAQGVLVRDRVWQRRLHEERQ